MKKVLLVFFLAAISIANLAAQDTPPAGSDIPNIDPQAMLADSINAIKASFGITTIGGETYAGFRVQPEFRIGKLVGFGLDIPVQFNINTREFRSDRTKPARLPRSSLNSTGVSESGVEI